MQMIDFDLLAKMCETPGAPGFEFRIRNAILDAVKDYVDDHYIDRMGNLVVVKKGTLDKEVMVTAHMDEISFVVTHIDDDGFIRFQPLGGFDPKTLTAQRVIIHGSEDIIGVMGTKPVHVMTKEEKARPLQLKDYFIDTGLPKDEVEKVVDIGNAITRERETIRMGKSINAKSLDNRVSVYILIEALRELKGQDIPYSLYGAFTVQEEVGIRGAMKATSAVDPEFGINLDVSVAFDLPGAMPQEKVTQMGKGTAIKILDGMTICDQRMVRYMKEVAKREGIDWQPEVLPAGGTDTAALQRGGKHGAIAGAISIPCRYLHQVIEMVDEGDVRASIDLLKASVKHLDSFDYNFG
jgi:endoglucanase